MISDTHQELERVRGGHRDLMEILVFPLRLEVLVLT